ncbi:MAG: SpoIIE family protein phosphatase [Planctomycetes bacterium]|nr:SpoIIE family protein phosphatase [Planctomycetota bacterium]
MNPTSTINIPGGAAIVLRLLPIGEPGAASHEVPSVRPTLIGRQSHCDIQLADQSVSREHCLIECRRGKWFVTDRNSRVGTLVNGARLTPGQSTTLDHNDVLGVARFSFRVQIGEGLAGAPMPTTGVTQRMAESEGRVHTVKAEQLLSRAERQLGLVMNLAAALHGAADERAMALFVCKAVAEGTGFRRAAFLRPVGGLDAVNFLAAVDGERESTTGFPVSRSLVRAAAQGEVATLTADPILRQAVSIIDAGVRTAVCAPVMMGGNADSFIYADNGDREATSQGDAAGFIAAVAHFASLAMAEQARKHLDERNQRLAADLTAARQAQERLMPASQGAVGPHSFAFKNVPGRLVAGDLADIIDLGNGRVAACLGDVSGKGVGAAMLMAAAQTQLRAALRTEQDLGAAVRTLNREVLSRMTAAGEFISLWVGVIDAAAATLSYIDAGHGYWLLRCGAETRQGPQPQYVPLGIEDSEAYEAVTIKLQPGDRIVIMSDGVAEQTNPAGEQFGVDRALAVVTAAASERDDVANLLRSLGSFADTEAWGDDVTVLSIGTGG